MLHKKARISAPAGCGICAGKYISTKAAGVLNRSGDMSQVSKSYSIWLQPRSYTGNGNMST